MSLICDTKTFFILPGFGCRQNTIRLEEKEKREKQLRSQIIEEAEEYKQAFYEKRKLNIESNRTTNRDREKVCYGLIESCSSINCIIEATKQFFLCIS